MLRISNIAVLVVGGIHFLIAGAEMFLFTNPIFWARLEKLQLEQCDADTAAPIVMNAGLYNAFLGAGLIWSVFALENAKPVKLFFLTCVVIAGIFGAFTLSTGILLVQTLPAVVAAILVWRGR